MSRIDVPFFVDHIRTPYCLKFLLGRGDDGARRSWAASNAALLEMHCLQLNVERWRYRRNRRRSGRVDH